MEVAIEIKTSKRIHETDGKALKILQEENKVKRSLLVSFESEPKIMMDNIECLPWKIFLEKLWNREFI